MTATPNAAQPSPNKPDSKQPDPTALVPGGQGRGRLSPALVTLGILTLFAWSWWSLDVEVAKFEGAGKRLAQFFSGLVPPDLTVMETVARSTLETLQIAYIGTVLSAILSLGAGLIAASNLTPAWVHQPMKWVLGMMRGIPLILVALVAVVAIGFGALAGVLAITFHATGMLGKFYAEAFENADPAPLEALESVGASWAQRIRFGALAQVAPDLVRDTLFRFELNFRESLVLGLVGAGGIGFYIQLYARSFQYEKVATLTVVVLLMVVAIEQISTWCRRRLR
ncbi:MAG: phosphonate ABC transporter, permease protein PhnE [Alphaproteobacteria bacterium]|nr:phosphonate ABC transporter, permease protein PhnE [Alphaproteobacteria bacterium]